MVGIEKIIPEATETWLYQSFSHIFSIHVPYSGMTELCFE